MSNKIKLLSIETGETFIGYRDNSGVIRHCNGYRVDFEEFEIIEPTNIIGGLINISIFAAILLIVAIIIQHFTDDDKTKFMRYCLQTANAVECESQWIVMQRDK